ncbi:MAG: hypothetical protein LBV74_20740 [Tannerella sp.]|jgi:hypothetical protein|nr:hypothetical protein [Tannerella sp.]
MKKLFLVANMMLLLVTTSGQSLAGEENYELNPHSFIVQTKPLRIEKKYDLLIKMLEDSITDREAKAWHYYQLACVYAQKQDSIKSFKYLYEYINLTCFARDILSDSDWESLYHTASWRQLKDSIIVLYLAKYPSITDKELSVKLWLHGIDDQRNRTLQKNNKQFLLFGKITDEQNEINKKALEERNEFVWHLLKKQRYLPTYSNVGKEASDAAFLIVQHASYQKKCGFLLERMKNSVENNEITKYIYTIFYDRYLIKNQQKQCYGTQYMAYMSSPSNTGVKIFLPIADEKNLNARRLSMEMPTIEEFAEKTGIIYQYHPEYERLPYKKVIKIITGNEVNLKPRE